MRGAVAERPGREVCRRRALAKTPSEREEASKQSRLAVANTPPTMAERRISNCMTEVSPAVFTSTRTGKTS